MKQYEVLMAKELFAGSDVVRKFSYKTTNVGKLCPFLANGLFCMLLTIGCNKR